jgi:hypothetical protein
MKQWQWFVASVHQSLVGRLTSSGRRSFKRVLFVFPLVLTMVFLGMKIWTPDAYTDLIQEDHFVENSQAVCYFLCFAGAVLIAVSFSKTKQDGHAVLYLLLSLIFLFVCLEEISWGQRVFHIPTPEWLKSRNMQGELTLHNMYCVQGSLHRAYILVGLLGAFSWLIIPKTRAAKSHLDLGYFVPDWYLMFYFLPVSFIYIFLGYISRIATNQFGLESFRVGHFVVWRDQEPAELLLSLGFLLFVLVNACRRSLSFSPSVPVGRQVLVGAGGRHGKPNG